MRNNIGIRDLHRAVLLSGAMFAPLATAPAATQNNTGTGTALPLRYRPTKSALFAAPRGAAATDRALPGASLFCREKAGI